MTESVADYITRLKQENDELKSLLDFEVQKREVLEHILEEIREMVNEPCVPSENDCLTCPTNCFTKDILIKINEVLGAEE